MPGSIIVASSTRKRRSRPANSMRAKPNAAIALVATTPTVDVTAMNVVFLRKRAKLTLGLASTSRKFASVGSRGHAQRLVVATSLWSLRAIASMTYSGIRKRTTPTTRIARVTARPVTAPPRSRPSGSS